MTLACQLQSLLVWWEEELLRFRNGRVFVVQVCGRSCDWSKDACQALRAGRGTKLVMKGKNSSGFWAAGWSWWDYKWEFQDKLEKRGCTVSPVAKAYSYNTTLSKPGSHLWTDAMKSKRMRENCSKLCFLSVTPTGWGGSWSRDGKIVLQQETPFLQTTPLNIHSPLLCTCHSFFSNDKMWWVKNFLLLLI